jgi:uncharacterized protein YjbJ (UPF0337 family)
MWETGNRRGFVARAHRFKGQVQTQWGKLTDDHFDVIAGKREVLVGKIQESYGIGKDEAKQQVKDFEARTKH